jgi:beta-glucanase (GH16 family)
MRLRAFGFTLAGLLVLARVAWAAPWDKPGYTITFHDEFDGTAVDPALWGERYKWGEAVINGELQAYVDDAFQFSVGVLDIVASKRQATYAGQMMNYASGLIASVHEQTYGYFEARCRMPKGQGFWPAFWLLGSVGTSGVNEIDIHEFLGSGTNTVYTTIHWGKSYNAPDHQSDGKAFMGPDFTADFHTFAVDWDSTHVIWYVDGAEVHRHEGVGVPQVSMYVIANLAVGGNWPGPPDTTTVFPGNYALDYIRAYQHDSDAGTVADAGAEAGEDAGADAAITGSDAGVPSDSAATTDVEPTEGSAPDQRATSDTDSAVGASGPASGGSKGCSCSSATPGETALSPLSLLLVTLAWRRKSGVPRA